MVLRTTLRFWPKKTHGEQHPLARWAGCRRSLRCPQEDMESTSGWSSLSGLEGRVDSTSCFTPGAREATKGAAERAEAWPIRLLSPRTAHLLLVQGLSILRDTRFFFHET